MFTPPLKKAFKKSPESLIPIEWEMGDSNSRPLACQAKRNEI